MNADSFFDTNVFLYAGSQAPEDATKRKIACELIRRESFAISAQIVQEFVVNALNKKSLGISEQSLRLTLEIFNELDVLPITLALIHKAIYNRERYQLSYWDAAVVAAAQQLKCSRLYSEDLNNGQNFDGVVVINPFFTN